MAAYRPRAFLRTQTLNPFHAIPRCSTPSTLSSEYHAAYTLLTKTGLNFTREQTIDLIIEGIGKSLPTS